MFYGSRSYGSKLSAKRGKPSSHRWNNARWQRTISTSTKPADYRVKPPEAAWSVLLGLVPDFLNVLKKKSLVLQDVGVVVKRGTPPSVVRAPLVEAGAEAGAEAGFLAAERVFPAVGSAAAAAKTAATTPPPAPPPPKATHPPPLLPLPSLEQLADAAGMEESRLRSFFVEQGQSLLQEYESHIPERPGATPEAARSFLEAQLAAVQLEEHHAQLRFDHADLLRRLQELQDHLLTAKDQHEDAVGDQSTFLLEVARKTQRRPSAPVIMHPHRFDICPRCGEDRIVVELERALLCKSCGVRSEHVDTSGQTMSVSYHNLDRPVSLVSPQRAPRLRDAIKHLTARHKNVVPDSIVIEITAHIYSMMGVTVLEEVEFITVRNAIKGLDLTNFLDYTMQIYCRIRGCAPPHLTARAEENFRVLFAAIQEPFMRLKPRPSTAFFSTPYLMLTLVKFLGYHELTSYFPLVKTRMKIDQQQELLGKVFRDLNWTPFPLLTQEEIATIM